MDRLMEKSPRDTQAPVRLLILWAVLILVASAAAKEKPLPESGFAAALASVRAAAAEIKLAQLEPAVSVKLEDSLDFLDSADVADGWAVAGHDLERMSAADKREREARLRGSFLFVKNVANGFIRRHLDSARQEILLKPLDAFQARELESALAARMRNLEMLEIKYGPNSAKLNVVEVLVNHFLLRGIPAFGVDAQGSPGPLEMVLSYSTSYVTPAWSRRDGTGILIASACEGGVRYYFLRPGWGRNALLPAYMAVGGLLAAKEEGVLRNPFAMEPDFGGFLSWGAVKAGIIFGDDTRVMLNRQFQFIPYLF